MTSTHCPWCDAEDHPTVIITNDLIRYLFSDERSNTPADEEPLS